MLLSTLFTTIISASLAFSQAVYDTNHNVTSLSGTWSTTSKGHVLTGPNFFNPVDRTFTIPEKYKLVTSRTFSFTDEGFWEECIFLPQHIGSGWCVATGAALMYQHGTYKIGSDGSMTLTPFELDGQYEARDPCGATNKPLPYAAPGYIKSWSIATDRINGPVLNLVRPHVPVQKLTRVYNPPHMLPIFGS